MSKNKQNNFGTALMWKKRSAVRHHSLKKFKDKNFKET